MKLTIFTSRQTSKEDYPVLVEWWNAYNFPPPPIEFLPDMGNCGLIISDDQGVNYCAGFIYETNSRVCWMEMIVANPDIRDRELRDKALVYLITQLNILVKGWGYKWVFTSVEHPRLKERYTECGFQIGSQGTTEMIKEL